jgi:HEPN domain-containing protein
MSEADRDALRDEARRWLRHAVEDERMVGLALAASPVLPGPAAYHAQQAAEKAPKAILVLRGRPVPRTHDLMHLLTLTGPPPAFDVAQMDALASLTPWAVQTRYPDLDEVGGPTIADIAAARLLLADLLRGLTGLLTDTKG